MAGDIVVDGENNGDSYGGGVVYWDKRHANDASEDRTFDWLFEFAHLRGLLAKHIAPDAAVLQLVTNISYTHLYHEKTYIQT